MADTSDLPIALRRTRRSLNQSAQQTSPAAAPACASPKRGPKQGPVARTPNSRNRRVRFSDPGPETTSRGHEPSATGLTPLVKRTSLSGSRTPRRRSTPGRLVRSSGSGIPEFDPQGSPLGGAVHFLPLRQVLDGRVKRRIRRNGLSEEMNAISAERRRRSEDAKAEIERLKAELAEKDEEIERLHDETVVLDTDRVWSLEQQVAALKRELASRSGVQQVPSSPASEWARATRDPFSDDSMELDVGDELEEFGEATRDELVCSTPIRRMCASFPTPPATSPEPELPQTPCRRQFTPRSSIGVQATFPEKERQQVEKELESLQLEVSKLTATLESYSALTSRLSDKMTTFSPCPPSSEDSTKHAALEQHLTTVLQSLSDRAAALAELNTSLKSLGFPGSDAFEVIDSLHAAFRSARLELEYLAPGEITLPLTGAGADVLNQVLTQLRNLAQKARDAEDSIDEYHAIELSLRQQLNARVTAMDALAAKLTTAEQAARAKDTRIADLEVGLDRLKHAAQTYTRDISELGALIQKMDSDLAARKSDLSAAQAQTQQLTANVTEKETTISTLETNLTATLKQITHLQTQLTTLSTTHASTLQSHKEELSTLTQTTSTSLAERNARITALTQEITRLNTSLREAQEIVSRLRGENTRLVGDNSMLLAEKRRAEEVVEGMRAGWERVVRMGEGLFGGGGAADMGAAVPGAVAGAVAGAGMVAGGDGVEDITSRGSKEVVITGDNQGEAAAGSVEVLVDGNNEAVEPRGHDGEAAGGNNEALSARGIGQVAARRDPGQVMTLRKDNEEVAARAKADELTAPRDDGKARRLLLSGDLASSGRFAKRRKYDSGLGFLDEELGSDV